MGSPRKYMVNVRTYLTLVVLGWLLVAKGKPPNILLVMDKKTDTASNPHVSPWLLHIISVSMVDIPGTRVDEDLTGLVEALQEKSEVMEIFDGRLEKCWWVTSPVEDLVQFKTIECAVEEKNDLVRVNVWADKRERLLSPLRTCLGGQYFHSTLGCQPCSPTCATCTSADSCESCASNYHRGGFLSTGLCTWMCSTHCVACSSATSCTICTSATGGYWNNGGVCVACGAHCADCSDGSSCDDCESGYIQVSTPSVDCLLTPCPSSTYRDVHGHCQPCAAHCVTCSSGTYCTHSRSSIGIDTLFPPVPSMQVNQNNSLLVSFDQDMDLNITKSDIYIGVTDNETSYNVTWDNPEILSMTNFTVKLTFGTPIPPSNSTVSLTFLTPGNVRSQVTDLAIQIMTLNGTLSGPVELKNTSEEEENPNPGFSRIMLLFSILTRGIFHEILSLLNFMEIIPLISIPIPKSLIKFMTPFEIILLIPNPVEYMYDKNNSKLNSPAIAKLYERCRSPLFLENAGVPILVIICVLLSLGLAALMSKRKRCLKCSEKLLSYMRWGLLLRVSMSFYMVIGIFSLIQLTTSTETDSLLLCSSLMAACFFLALFVISPFLLLWFLVKNKEKMMDRKKDIDFNKRWGILFLNFNRQVSALLYYFLFLVRRMLYVFNLIILNEYTKLQAGLNFAISLCVRLIQSLLYLLKYRPFEETLELIAKVFEEIAVLVIFLIMSCYISDLDDTTSIYLEWAAMVVISVAIFSTPLIFLVQCFKCTKDWIQKSKMVHSTSTPATLHLSSGLSKPRSFSDPSIYAAGDEKLSQRCRLIRHSIVNV